MTPPVELYSRDCVARRHNWCDGTVKAPPDLIPDGQDSLLCRCSCHRRPERGPEKAPAEAS